MRMTTFLSAHKDIKNFSIALYWQLLWWVWISGTKRERDACSFLSTYLVFSDPVPVEQHEIEADAIQPLGPLGDLEDKALVEHWVQGPFLDVRFLLGDALVVEQQIDFDIGVCNQAWNASKTRRPQRTVFIYLLILSHPSLASCELWGRPRLIC